MNPQKHELTKFFGFFVKVDGFLSELFMDYFKITKKLE